MGGISINDCPHSSIECMIPVDLCTTKGMVDEASRPIDLTLAKYASPIRPFNRPPKMLNLQLQRRYENPAAHHNTPSHPRLKPIQRNVRKST
jgi:hypothetical protein